MHAGSRSAPRRRALVLAGGGILGGLYQVGALLALDAFCEGFGSCHFELHVRSQAGAFIASLPANRLTAQPPPDALEPGRRPLPRLPAFPLPPPPGRRQPRTIPRLAGA